MILCFLLISLAVSSQIVSPDSLAVTIYNDGFGIVKDVRVIQFSQGESKLYFTDVSENIQTETVTFKAMERPESVRVYEQNFQKNLISQDGLLKRYIEKNIDIVAQFGNQAKRVSGILLAYSPNVILKTDKGIISVNKISAFDVASVPQDFFTKPTLNWKVYSDSAQTQKCELAYRTTGFQWKADYIITINEQETKADFGGWVTIDNNSGKKYVNAKLKLIAGDVNVVKPVPNYTLDYMYAMPSPAPMAKMAPQFTEKSFSDYHMYTLSGPVTLNDSSQKQVQFIPKVFRVPIRKYNQIVISSGGYNQNNLKASTKIRFNNTKSVGLGMPMPKGTVRVFKQDNQDKSLQFIGEDSIGHTPKDQNITLSIGNSFDVVVDVYAVSRTNYDRGYSAVMNMTVTNHKQVPAEIQILINKPNGDNTVIKWDPSNPAKIQPVSSYQLKVVQVLKPDEKVWYKWTEDYRY